MNNFQIISIIDTNTLKVEPKWQFQLKNGEIISGNKVKIRGLDEVENPGDHNLIIERLKKLLIGTNKPIQFNAPELIDTTDHSDAIVSCSVYVSQTNINYYFPEFAYK